MDKNNLTDKLINRKFLINYVIMMLIIAGWKKGGNIS